MSPQELETMIVASAMVMMLAGFETSALTMGYALWCLSGDLNVQERLQAEIDEAFENNEANVEDGMLDYGTIQGLKYLDQGRFTVTL
jgi:cytochrome P450